MHLISLKNIYLSYGHPPLLQGIDLSIEKGQKIALLGRNGEGKSSLMKIIAGLIPPDDGQIFQSEHCRMAYLPQEVPQDQAGTVFDCVATGLAAAQQLQAYHHLIQQPEPDWEQLQGLQQALEDQGAWQLEQRIETILSKMKLNPEADFAALSGGMKRRVLLAKALVNEPDLLLLDEPTNHLDIEAIAWLEDFLSAWSGSLLFISHDRAFLSRLANRIIELDRGQLYDYRGDYANYLRRKEEREQAEKLEQARFNKKLKEEEIWIRQGIKARRTRNQGRVRRLQAMREQAQQRREQQGQAKLISQEAIPSGKLVCEAQNISYAWQGRPIIQDFSTTILRGDKIGIIGPNGCGKTTLIQLLIGQLKPDSGQIKLGSQLRIAYFDQMRAQLDEDANLVDNIGGGKDHIQVNGRSRHVIGYLQDFLFAPQRARQPVKALSGGEKNRLLLAKLFTQPANLLILDEPTNDLDIETLELLEALLVEFEGTVLLVSHDRRFLDHVVSSSLVFEAPAQIRSYIGGYSDWLRQRPKTEHSPTKSTQPKKNKPKNRAPKKLSYKEAKELQALPQQIEAWEEQQAYLEAKLADPQLYKQSDSAAIKALQAELQQLQQQLEQAYERWQFLEEKAS